MTDKLPPNLLALFAPRPPLKYIQPADFAPEQRRTAQIGGLAAYLPLLQLYKETDVYTPTESHMQRKDRVRQDKKAAVEKLTTVDVKNFHPENDPKIQGDPFKTLCVARLSYDVDEKDLRREFGRYGPIRSVRIVENTHVAADAPLKKRKRGYAFIEYDHEKDMKAAYKESDGIIIKGRRVTVDVERGRTVANWKPRRLGGGLGGRHYTKAPPARPSGPGFLPNGPGGPSGFGSRGGFNSRGGFQGGRGGGSRGDFGGPRGGGGFRGGYNGPSRGGIGYQSNGFGGPPDGAPAGPRGGGRGGFNPGGGGYSRDRFAGSGSGSNREALGSRGGGYRDRDGGGGRENGNGYGDSRGGSGRDDFRKRPHDGDGYDGDRSRRRLGRAIGSQIKQELRSAYDGRHIKQEGAEMNYERHHIKGELMDSGEDERSIKQETASGSTKSGYRGMRAWPSVKEEDYEY